MVILLNHLKLLILFQTSHFQTGPIILDLDDLHRSRERSPDINQKVKPCMIYAANEKQVNSQV